MILCLKHLLNFTEHCEKHTLAVLSTAESHSQLPKRVTENWVEFDRGVEEQPPSPKRMHVIRVPTSSARLRVWLLPGGSAAALGWN
jgi:hypothetical protein